MKNFLIILILILLTGCAPKLGQDIIVDIDKKGVTLENSTFELITTGLSYTGVPLDKSPIKIKGFVNIENKWWKSIEIKTISYEILQNNEVIAKGNAIIDGSKEIKSGEKSSIPLTLIIDSKSITKQKMIKRLTNTDIIEVQGKIIVSSFGKEIEKNFKNRINK